MARPVDLCMKSMRNTTGLAPGAGVVELCSFPVTLSPQSRGSGRRAAQTAGSGDPAEALTRPPSLLPFTEPSAHPGCRRSRAATAVVRAGPFNGAGEEGGSRRHRNRPKNLHSTTIPARMARPVDLCMKSMRNTTGLAPGAKVVEPMQLSRDTLATKPRFGRRNRANRRLRRPATTLTHSLPSAVFRAARQAMPWTLKGPRSESRQPRLALRQPRLALQQPPRHAKPPRRRPPTARPPAGSGPVTPTPRPGWPLRSSGSCPRRA
jgi:hypothetical protein